ncbi:MAG: ABC transporter permease subunit [Planctomycetota bacterium]|nr:ABC transporter permease subunit [Planctomycetota bacterium]
MAVYARGYRPYEGSFGGRSPVMAIFGQGFRNAIRTRSFKILGVLVLIFYVIFTIQMYVMLNIEEVVSEGFSRFANRNEPFDFATYTTRYLKQALMGFYGFVATVGALISMLAGAGIVADDLRTRALPLYLVRPIRPIEYVLGKALVLPAVLAIVLLSPGLTFYLFAGLWQPDGTTNEWLGNNVDILGNVIHSYLVASFGFTGLMLFLSARTPRRGTVMAIAAAVYFGGAMMAGLGSELRGVAQQALKHVSLIVNSVSAHVMAEAETDRWRNEAQMERFREEAPSPTIGMVVAIAVLLIGAYAVYRRARSTEVSE